MLRRAYYRAKANTSRLLKDLDVTPMQAACIMTLHRRGTISQAELGREIGMEPANVHGLVARLRKRSLVEIDAHRTDQRQVAIGLSGAGKSCATKIARLTAQSAAETLAPLAPAEREIFMELLARIAHAEDPDARFL